MSYKRVYAYGIHVGGQKKCVGTIHANSMEEAIKGLIGKELNIDRKDSVYRPFDGATIPQAEWMWNGERAMVYIWAPPEYF